MMSKALSRLGNLNEQLGLNKKWPEHTVRYLDRVEGAANVDYNSEFKGTLKVKEFYEGQNILITGCTGFLAKVILEKILRTCPDVGKIYIMVR